MEVTIGVWEILSCVCLIFDNSDWTWWLWHVDVVLGYCVVHGVKNSPVAGCGLFHLVTQETLKATDIIENNVAFIMTNDDPPH